MATRRLHAMSDPKPNDCDDVEITPEMIEAGTTALCVSCDELSSKTEVTLEWIVSSVYAAMDSASGTTLRHKGHSRIVKAQ